VASATKVRKAVKNVATAASGWRSSVGMNVHGLHKDYFRAVNEGDIVLAGSSSATICHRSVRMYGLRPDMNRKSGSALKEWEVFSKRELF
jgi:hypothetical protein